MVTSSLYAGLKVTDVQKPALGTKTSHFLTWLHSDTHSHTHKHEHRKEDTCEHIQEITHTHTHTNTDRDTHLSDVRAEWQNLA